METQWKLGKKNLTKVKITKIISYRKTIKQQRTTSTLLLDGGNPCKKKRKYSDPPEPAPHPSSIQHTAESLALMLDTCTDTEFKQTIGNCRHTGRQLTAKAPYYEEAIENEPLGLV